MEIGFLGLGIMGKAMSINLLHHGFKVTVWNRTLSKCDELVEHGATVGETPAAVVKKCKLCLIRMVFLSKLTEKVILTCPQLMPRHLLRYLMLAIKAKGGDFLEAPVSGGKTHAEDGQLVIIAAGHKALYEEALPAFDVLGKKSFFLGAVGDGAKMKLAVNAVMGSMMNAFSEGLRLVERSGLNPRTLLDVLDHGAMSNGLFKSKGPTMLKNSYNPGFPLKHMQKDMRLSLALGDENAVPMPVAAAANEAFEKAKSTGLGDLDFSAVIKTLN